MMPWCQYGRMKEQAIVCKPFFGNGNGGWGGGV